MYDEEQLSEAFPGKLIPVSGEVAQFSFGFDLHLISLVVDGFLKLQVGKLHCLAQHAEPTPTRLSEEEVDECLEVPPV